MSTKKKRQPARSQVPAEFRSGSASPAPAQPAPESQSEKVMLPLGWKPFTDSGFISQPQHSYICGMLDKRDLLSSETFRAKVEGMDAGQFAAYIAELKETFKRLPRKKASELIETLKALPYKQKASKGDTGDTPAKKVPDVHAGRYALLHPEDELNPVRFYKVSEGKDNTEKGGKDWSGAIFLVRFASDDTFPVKYQSAEYYRVLEQIAANPLEAAQRFGDEWECCSQCGRGLTRRLSRKLRIGPVCLTRAGWVVDPDAYVEQAKAEIIAEGHDPNETLPHTKKRPPRRRAW